MHLTDFHRAVAAVREGIALFEVDYRGLVTHPEETLRNLCQFIGEDYVPAMLAFHDTDRARALAGSPEFAGAAKPVYARASEPRGSGPLLNRAIRVYDRQVARITTGRTAMPLWEWPVRVLVYARAAAYQAGEVVAGWRGRS
jgi:hypothetical protein